jgi:hypothetical protein
LFTIGYNADMNKKEKQVLLILAAAVSMLLLMLGALAWHKDNAAQKEQPLEVQLNHSVTEEKPATEERPTANEIYNNLRHGMLLTDVITQFGNPSSDTEIGRPLIYGGDNTDAIAQTEQNIPTGRNDGGGTRSIVYRCPDGKQVNIVAISTVDAEHPETNSDTSLIWIVNQYHLSGTF